MAVAIFWQLRLPRVLLGLLAGAGLAVSGLGFQTLFRNELAEPYTLGIASGAALGAVLALRLEENAALLGRPVVALASFAGAIGATLLVVGLAGSFVGGLLISLLSGDGLALRPSGIIGSILGALVLLAAWRAIRPTTRRRTR